MMELMIYIIVVVINKLYIFFNKSKNPSEAHMSTTFTFLHYILTELSPSSEAANCAAT
jgi:hypothetical protein